VHDFLSAGAAQHPDAIAIVEPSRQITYAALDAQANRVAHLLLGRGLERGDRVILALDNSIEFVAAYLGTMKAGAVAVPLPPGARSDRLAAAIADCEPRACVVDVPTIRDAGQAAALAAVPHRFLHAPPRGPRPPGETFPLLDAALAACSPAPPPAVGSGDDLAAIIYTSGSTGEPRGVMLRHGNLTANAASIVAYLELTAADRVMCVLPLYYVYGLSLLHTHLLVGAAVVIDNRFAFPNVVLDAMVERAVTGFAGVPSSFALLLHKSNLPGMALPSLRYVTQAGGSMPPARIREWLERGPPARFFVMYGATEAAARLAYLPPERLQEKLGSIGVAVPDVAIRVLRDDGTTAAPGEVGELVASGPNIAAGYWRNPVETAERFTPAGFRTGDLGYADDEGFLFLAGRRYDMIKVGANRVGAREIEDALCDHPAVSEAAVVAAPHEILGEAPIAFVVLREAVAGPEAVLAAHCGQRLPPYKLPVRYVLSDDLPRLPTGKVDKRRLRALVTQTG
jgi:amino acid adenylation domain-containing protein